MIKHNPMKYWLNAKIITTLPIFIAVNIAALVVWGLNISAQTMPMILGIIAGGLVDLDNRLTGRIKNLFYTLLAFSISSFIVQLTIGNGVEYLLLMTAITFIFTMIGALGQRYSTIAFGSLVIALYTTLSYQPEQIWYLNPLLILFGTLLYSSIALLVHLCFPNRPVQENVANAFLALANYLDAKAAFFDPDDIEQLHEKEVHLAMKDSQLIDVFNACRTALFYRIRGQHRHTSMAKMIRYYFSAQDIHERANSSLFDYQVLAHQLKNTDLIFRIQRLLELQAQACREIGHKLKRDEVFSYDHRVEKAIIGLSQSYELYASQHPQQDPILLNIKTLIDNLQSINWQIRHLDQDVPQSEQSETAKIHTEQITGLKNIWLTLRGHCHLESQLFRHAIRLSIVVFLCCAIVECFELHFGYWILLTAVFVCQPNYTATKLRLKQRIIGTLLGVIVGSLLPYIHPTLELQLGLIVATSTLFFFFRSNNYSFSTFFITIQVLISFDVMGFDIHSAMLSRVVDTLIGAAIAWFAVSYLWPDWKYLQLDKISRYAVKSNGRYLLYVIGQLQFGKGDNLSYRVARRKAHEYATALSTTLSNMNNEAKKYDQKLLKKGFELVKVNYSLLSYIAALGAYRHEMKQLQQSTQFLADFYPAAKKIIYVLERLEKLPPEVFQKLQDNIEQTLKHATAAQAGNLLQPQFNVPIQQLNMISQVLPTLYQLFKQDLHIEQY